MRSTHGFVLSALALFSVIGGCVTTDHRLISQDAGIRDSATDARIDAGLKCLEASAVIDEATDQPTTLNDAGLLVVDARNGFPTPGHAPGTNLYVGEAPEFMRTGKWSFNVTPDFDLPQPTEFVDQADRYVLFGFGKDFDGGSDSNIWQNWMLSFQHTGQFCFVLGYEPQSSQNNFFCEGTAGGLADLVVQEMTMTVTVDTEACVVTIEQEALGEKTFNFKGKAMDAGIAKCTLPEGRLQIGSQHYTENGPSHAHHNFKGTYSLPCEVR